MIKGACFIWGKLNYKCSIMFFISTVYNATLLSTTGVLQILSLPQIKQKTKKV